MPAPIIPEIVFHPATSVYTTPLSRDQRILANRLAQAVQGFSLQEDSTTTQSFPKDPFNDDVSSGQQIQLPKMSGNVPPMLLNERLMAKQLSNSGQFSRQIASVNELPLPSNLQFQLPKPIVPEVVVRGAAIQDSRLRNNLRLCPQPF